MRLRPAPAQSHSSTAEQYLDRLDVAVHLRGLVAEVLEHRPLDPVLYVSEHLRDVLRQRIGGNELQRCCHYVRRSKSSSRTFLDNLGAAYATFDSNQGLTVSRLGEFLRVLCQGMPIEVVTSIGGLVDASCLRSGRVPFAEFVSVVQISLIYEELVSKAAAVFQACVADTTEGMSTRVFLALVKQVRLGAVPLLKLFLHYHGGRLHCAGASFDGP